MSPNDRSITGDPMAKGSVVTEFKKGITLLTISG